MQAFHANGTVRSRALFDALVRALYIVWIAHITHRTVKEIFFATDATNSAVVAVKLAFVSIVVQTASGTKVKSKLDSTLCAMRHDMLQFTTLVALDMLNVLPL